MRGAAFAGTGCGGFRHIFFLVEVLRVSAHMSNPIMMVVYSVSAHPHMFPTILLNVNTDMTCVCVCNQASLHQSDRSAMFIVYPGTMLLDEGMDKRNCFAFFGVFFSKKIHFQPFFFVPPQKKPLGEAQPKECFII